MERAGRVLASLNGAKSISPEKMMEAAWPAVVGKRLATRTRVAGVVRDRLVIEVEDALWQRNFHQLRAQILAKFETILGPARPRDLEFRIGVPRRGPHMEVPRTKVAAPLFDEADSIGDPGMSMIYRIARRKAGA